MMRVHIEKNMVKGEETYTVGSVNNLTKEEITNIANYLLDLVNQPAKSKLTFEIAPKSSEKRGTWKKATDYCNSLMINGKTGWRLPTKEELREIYENENDFREETYWSSTKYSADSYWAQGFYVGTHSGEDKGSTGIFVRAVRDLKDN